MRYPTERHMGIMDYPIHLEIITDYIIPEPYVQNIRGRKVLFITDLMTLDIWHTFDAFEATRALSDFERRIISFFAKDYTYFAIEEEADV